MEIKGIITKGIKFTKELTRLKPSSSNLSSPRALPIKRDYPRSMLMLSTTDEAVKHVKDLSTPRCSLPAYSDQPKTSDTPERMKNSLKDALQRKCQKFNKWLSALLRNKEKLEEIAITTINAECSAIILNKVPEKLEDPGKFLIPCALQELDRTNALADSGASINLLPHSIYKQLGLGALKPTRMTLELANRTVTHPMGHQPEDVKDEQFSGSTTIHSDALLPSSSPVKTSDNLLEEFTDEFTLPNPFPLGNDDSILKKDVHE
ncbi:reverse transcriptase domain-containing protein [Tanacetum coccineum]